MTNNRCPGEKKLQQQQEEGEEDPPRPGIWLDVRLSVCLSNKKLYFFVVSEKEVLILSGQTRKHFVHWYTFSFDSNVRLWTLKENVATANVLVFISYSPNNCQKNAIFQEVKNRHAYFQWTVGDRWLSKNNSLCVRQLKFCHSFLACYCGSRDLVAASFFSVVCDLAEDRCKILGY